MRNDKILRRFIKNFLVVNSIAWLLVSVVMFFITVRETYWSFVWLLIMTTCSSIGLTIGDFNDY